MFFHTMYCSIEKSSNNIKAVLHDIKASVSTKFICLKLNSKTQQQNYNIVKLKVEVMENK